MSLDTYANLKQEIIDWSHRDDLDLKIDTFIDMAESKMFANSVEPLKLRDQETREAFSTSITTRFAALPAGYQSQRKLRIQITNGESIKLTYRAPEQLEILSSVGIPLFFTITDQIEFERISDQVYTGEIQYIQEFTPLSSSNTTNAVLTNHPEIYLFGSMWALKKHANEDAESADYYAQFIDAIKGANKKANAGRYGPSLSMTIDGPTP